MYGSLSLQRNNSGSYDLIILYTRHEMEFGLDFLSPAHVQSSRQAVADYLTKFGQGLTIQSAKIMADSTVLAALPIHLLLPSAESNPKQLSMAYLCTDSPEQQLEQLRWSGDMLNTVSPSIFALQPDGTLKINTHPYYLTQLRALGMQIIPFLDNHNNRQTGEHALENPEKLVEQLAKTADELELDGVGISLHGLTAAHREAYVDFLSLLRDKLPADKALAVAMAATPYGWALGNHRAFSYADLAGFADYLVLVPWEGAHHNATPAASARYLEGCLRCALKYAKPEQVIAGLHLSGRLWSKDNTLEGCHIPLATVENILTACDPLLLYDQHLHAPKAVFTLEDNSAEISINGQSLCPGEYQLWYENDASLQAKLDLVETYQLKGVCLWPLEHPASALWNTYRSWRGNPVSLTNKSFSTPQANGVAEKKESIKNKSRRPDAMGISITPVPGEPPVQAVTLPQTGQVTAPGAALRKGPGEDNSITTTLQSGAMVTVLDNAGEWHLVQLPVGTTGYLHQKDFRLHKTQTIAHHSTQARSAPADSAPPIAVLSSGTAVTVLETHGEAWSKVRLADKRVGFLPTRQLSGPDRAEQQVNP